MARDRSMARAQRMMIMTLLDGTRPAGALEWVSPLAPVVTQAAIGAGHWAAGRRRRALAAWTSAAGFGLMAWGLGTEAPTRAELEPTWRQVRDLARQGRGLPPAAAGTPAPAAHQPSRRASLFSLALQVVGLVFGVRSGLRHPPRLTPRAIVAEAWPAAFYVLRVPRAMQRRRPRIAAGSALAIAGSVARLRAASAEPLR